MSKYQLIKESYIEEVQSNVKLLKHIKSGARVLLLENEDNNKVFTVGFRTPPTNDTGVPHILEHSTLCGSKKFPVKDPFIELLKSSLNTFLNAMTFPDKTIYPVASCNEKDFKNLMEVYMDAVFYPNVYIHEEIFKQEGWHYELESVDSDIIYNGVVYNEMKGAFSSAEQVIDRMTRHFMYPDTPYGVESGGDPDFIPELTYEEFKNFHARFYSPANSYIILYGNMNMEERLEWMDKEYLSNFDIIETNSEIKYQQIFNQPIEKDIYYPVGKEESLENKTYYSCGVVIGDYKDDELALAMTILQYTLLQAPGAPLKQALLDAGIGKDIMSSYDSGLLQPTLMIVTKDAPANKLEEFKEVINKTLKDIIKNGLNKKALKAAINYFEFKYRESDFGRAPKGLVFTINALETWLYDENNPTSRLETNKIFKLLNEKVDTDYFENLIDIYILNNNHKVFVTANPSNTISEEKELALKEKLKAYKETLTKEQLEQLVEDTKALKEYQATPSSSEDLKSIPLLTIKDIDDYVEPLYNKEEEINNVKIIKHDLFTNGIGYLRLHFNTKNIPNHLVPYIGLLSKVLGKVDTSKYTYQDLTVEINANTGGISTPLTIISLNDNDFLPYFTIKASSLFEKSEFVINIINEIIKESDFSNEKRLYEIIAETKSQLQMYLMGAGHAAAYTRAGSYVRSYLKYQDETDGIGQYLFIEQLEKDFQNRKEELTKTLETLMTYIFRKENLIISYTGNSDLYKEYISNLINELYTNEIQLEEYEYKQEILNEGFKTPSQVQYVARFGHFDNAGSYTGAFLVFGMALRYDYLWTQIRVLGGAYGCMTQTSRQKDIYLVSYRDPNLERTNDVFENVLEYLDTFNPTKEELTKYVIGAIGTLDEPLSPRAKGDVSFNCYIKGITYEDLLKERHEVMNVTLEDIKALKPLIKECLDQQIICTIGNETKVDSAKQLFKVVKNLFN